MSLRFGIHCSNQEIETALKILALLMTSFIGRGSNYGQTSFRPLNPRHCLAYREQMIKLALLCLVIAAVAAILGFGRLAGTMVDVAIVLAVIAAVLFVVFLLLGIFAGKKAKDLLD